MVNKTFQGRIVQKHDTKANWDKAINFIPLKGEIIIYDDLRKIKIGDGTTKVGDLIFINNSELDYKNIINDPYHLKPASESECYIISNNNKADAIKIDIANLPNFLSNQEDHYFYFDNQDVSDHYLLIYNGTTKIKQANLLSVKYINIRTNTFDTNGNPDIIFMMSVTTDGLGTIGYSYKISTGDWQVYSYLNDKLSNYAKITDLATVATSGNYNDLANKPTIPTKLSDLTDDVINRKYLPLTGGTMTGDIDINNNNIVNLHTLYLNSSKDYAPLMFTGYHDGTNSYLSLIDSAGKGIRITGIIDPIQNDDVATKRYVDDNIPSITIITWSDDGT